MLPVEAVGLEYCALKSLEHFSFNSCKVVFNITYFCLENGDFANLLLKYLMGKLPLDVLISPKN